MKPDLPQLKLSNVGVALLVLCFAAGAVLWSQVDRGFQGEAAKKLTKDYWRKNLSTYKDWPLPDVTVYALQLATSVLGPVRRVTALANRGAPERHWQGTTITVEVPELPKAQLKELDKVIDAYAQAIDNVILR